jgi:hypothetical protein
MNRALAPSWLPRQQRRRLDRALRKLMHRNVCSFCGSSFKHNSRTAGGFDAQGNVVLAGECCTNRVAEIFVRGLYSDRKYDFLLPREPQSSIEPSNEQINEAIAAYQKVIAEADKHLGGVERRGGARCVSGINLLDSAWKDDDREWFERNPSRSHRARLPLPGELDKEGLEAALGQVLILLIRQVEPGARIRAAVTVDVDLLPIPDDEAAAHALFEVAVGREGVPPDRQALCTLIKKYAVHREPGQ